MPIDRTDRFDSIIPYTGTNLTNWITSVDRVVTRINNGKTNNTNEITLTENSATTTVTLPHGVLGQDTVIVFMPTTANAATEFGAGSMYVSARSISNRYDTNSTFTITHANNAQTDRTFRYIMVG